MLDPSRRSRVAGVPALVALLATCLPADPSGDAGSETAASEDAPEESGASADGTGGDPLEEVVYVKASNTDPDDLFGISLALSPDGTTLVVAAGKEASASTGVTATTKCV